MTKCYSTTGAISKIALTLESMLRANGYNPDIAYPVTILCTPDNETITRQRVMVVIELSNP